VAPSGPLPLNKHIPNLCVFPRGRSDARSEAGHPWPGRGPGAIGLCFPGGAGLDLRPRSARFRGRHATGRPTGERPEWPDRRPARHNVVTPDGDKVEALGGQNATGTIEVPAEGTTFLCDIPGHADAGMKGTITVAGSGTATGSDDHGGALPTGDVAADPAAPPYTVFDPKAPALASGSVHDIDLVIEEKTMTVADGFVQKVWTFGGTVPGAVSPIA